VVEEMLAALDSMSEGGRMKAVKDIFGSEEVMQVVAALQGKGRAAFTGILEVQAGSEDFLDFLNEQADDSATELQKLKESVRAVLDEAITPLLGYLTEHSEGLKNMVKWIGKNPLKTGFALLFGPSLIKIVGGGIVSAISKSFAAKTVTEGISSGLKGAATMTVYATNVNVVGGKGGVPGAVGKGLGAAAPAAGAAPYIGMGGKFLSPAALALAAKLGLPAGAMLKMLGPAALGGGLGTAAMGLGAAGVGAGVLGFVGAGLSDYQKRTSGQSMKNVWTRAEELGEESRASFKSQYESLPESQRTAAKLNQMIDILQAIERKDTTLKTKITVNQSGGGDTPPLDVEAH